MDECPGCGDELKDGYCIGCDERHPRPIVERPPNLYLKNGKRASMKDLMRWWQYHYPPDIFISGPLPIIHNEMDRLLTGKYVYSKKVR